ncbi:MAG: beta-lactamase family protein [Acidimicrobiia bacterium]|nr:beta-lactamase family protein [Acidimicrobiia bacterium]
MADLRWRDRRRHVACVVEAVDPHRVISVDAQRPDWPLADADLGPTVTWAELAGQASVERSSTLPADLAASIDRRLASARLAMRSPAVAAAVVYKGELAHVSCVGAADVFPLAAAHRRCGLRIGSITKTITAIAVMRLVERGVIDLDAPANSLLNQTRITCEVPGAAPVTVRHLLTHTAGLPRNREGFDIAVPSDQPLPPLGEFYGPEFASVRPPGQREYSNDGYGLLALLVEDVTGERFEDHLIGNVFEPLGMHDTGCEDEPRTADCYRGLDVRCGVVATAPATRDATRGGGSVVTTIEDLATYVRALMSHDGLPGLLGHRDGIRVFESREAFGEHIGYFTGGMYGAQADIRFAPGRDIGIAVFANVYSRYSGALFTSASHQILGDLLAAG